MTAPSTSTRRADQDPLSSALLPVLLHKLAGATQLLSGLNALLALEGGEHVLSDRADDLADASRQVDRLGWLLGVLASASGADLLLERREPRGLEILIELLADALRREERTLAAPRAPLPDLAPDALDGWQVPWAVGSLLLAAGDDREEGAAVAWSITRAAQTVRLSVPAGARTSEALSRACERLPGACAEPRDGELVLALPAAWLRFEQPDAGVTR